VLAVSPNGRYLATSETAHDFKNDAEARNPDAFPVSTTLRVWDLTNRGTPVFTDSLADFVVFEGHTPKPADIAFSPDSSKVATGWCCSFVIVYDALTGRRLVTQDGSWDDSVSVAALTFTADGRLLVQRDSGDVLATDMPDLPTVTTHATPFIKAPAVFGGSAIANSSDGRLLFALSGDQEGALSILDTGTKSPLTTGLRFPMTGADLSIAPTSDGHLFFSTAIGIARLDLDVERWKAAACALAGRPLTKQEWATYLPGAPYRPACG
jgi:WD40 repeat protein